jgi:DNA adenine methylase
VQFFTQYRQSRQALGKDFATPTIRIRRGMNENVSAWLSAVDGLPEAFERVRRMEFCCMDGVKFIRQFDHPKRVFYCDPPYLHKTRTAKDAYRHEMTQKQHLVLLDTLESISGRFLLSGYRSAMYDAAALCHGWHRREFPIVNNASGKKTKEPKVECVWTNYESPEVSDE